MTDIFGEVYFEQRYDTAQDAGTSHYYGISKEMNKMTIHEGLKY